MENFKFTLITIVGLGLLSLLGYWAITSIQSGSAHVSDQKIKELEIENEALKGELAKFQSDPSSSGNNTKVENSTKENVVNEPSAKPDVPVTPIINTNQSLINDLQKLADAGTVLRLKSTGPAVGSVEKFFNIYNKTSNKIDNDYGASLKNAVLAFQKAQGLPVTGEIGVKTLTKMVTLLKN